ncbi:MAG: diguanylate cyclase [Nitrospinae bacterium]|nr:diguanylate cyclase [Nitrospinota bacterium]
MNNGRIRIGLLGSGSGAVSVMQILRNAADVELVGLAYRTDGSPGVRLAREMGLPVYDNYRKLADSPNIDLLIDATGNPEVEAWLVSEIKSHAQILSGYSAWFLWRMVEEHEARQAEMERHLSEQERLYSTGVLLASAENTEQTLRMIVESAQTLTGMAAATLALYDEEKGEMSIKVNLGFGEAKLPGQFQWKVRTGGLTGAILSNDGPTVIEDMENAQELASQNLTDLGVRSLMAMPLKVEGKIVGILYVDDFTPKKFTERQLQIFRLLCAQAAVAIEKALLLEATERLAVTDELTRLFNHRYFMSALHRETERATRYKQTLTLLMIDVDHFKRYNDTQGHPMGNVALRELATIFRAASRATDVVARYGGEEFAVIFVETDARVATLVAERIRKAVEAHPFEGEDALSGGKLTVSMGLASFPAHAATMQALLEAADKALYRSKAEGRNRVTLATLEN